MAVEFKLPELGEGISEADVVEVLVSEGDTIAAKQDVFEAETEKASMPIPSDVAGTITKIHIKAGDTVKIGQTILTVEANGEAAAPAKQDKPAKAEKKDAAPKEDTPAPAAGGESVDFMLPELGEGVKEADITEVLVSEGDTVSKNDDVLDVEAEKGSFAVPITVAGKITKIHVGKGDTVKPGQKIMTVESSGDAPAKAAPSASKSESKPVEVTSVSAADAAPSKPAGQQPAGEPAPIAAAPSVRHFAREIGVDIYDVPGSGPGGRITEEDVKTFARSVLTGETLTASTGGGDAPVDTREAMSKIRKVTAKHMAHCWDTIPHVTLTDKADVTHLEATREKYKKFVEKKGGRLTITPIFVKLVATGLQVYKNLNASIDMESQEVVHRNYVNIGVAVDTKRGLVVPVVRDAHKKSIIDIAVELQEISEKARTGKLTLQDMQGGTFTITNLGSIGTGFFTPIVNSPEVAILGMGRSHKEPVWSDATGAFEPRDMAPLSLSFDHRLVDGADGARFLQWLVEAVEMPLVTSML